MLTGDSFSIESGQVVAPQMRLNYMTAATVPFNTIRCKTETINALISVDNFYIFSLAHSGFQRGRQLHS